MSVSVFEHAWLGGLFADAELQELFSAEAQIAHMCRFERALADALEHTDRIDPQAATAARLAIDAYQPDWAALRAGMALDGVVAPSFVKELRAQAGNGAGIHTGATSQDVIDTSLALTLQAVSSVLERRLDALETALADLSAKFGDRELIGRTRMQAALPIQAAHRIESWRAPLDRARMSLPQVAAAATLLSLGGPVGTGTSFDSAYDEIADRVAGALGLVAPPRARHVERDGIVAYGDLMSRISGALGKLGQDIALMAQQGIAEVRLSGGGVSSAMAHKQNPVLAELLVTLARFNAAQTAAMHAALVHEQERSGSAWALEWMVLPQMIVATGRGLCAAKELIEQIDELAA